jgi:hypothetical protein
LIVYQDEDNDDEKTNGETILSMGLGMPLPSKV